MKCRPAAKSLFFLWPRVMYVCWPRRGGNDSSCLLCCLAWRFLSYSSGRVGFVWVLGLSKRHSFFYPFFGCHQRSFVVRRPLVSARYADLYIGFFPQVCISCHVISHYCLLDESWLFICFTFYTFHIYFI